ncbi:MAG: hypothetical protein K0Q90_583 [Paenibacillaceae bacterium]|jgi:uncharacterized protein YbbK (DUF523 family)|nr:hypothetical protein [Paenibacillaceae bacterium]
MKKILISSCLLGEKVRYNGEGKPCVDPRLARWQQEGRLIPVCPEVEGGLPVPRPPAQRLKERVVTEEGGDVTAEFRYGAEAALALARQHEVSLAILKQNSPSCGSRFIHDGSFQGVLIPGEGITTELLRQHGIPVFGEDQLNEAEQALAALSGD